MNPELKRILIIAYFFPPSNFVGGERVASWAKYLHHYGYYPIIVTRNWNNNQQELTDPLQDNTLKHEVYPSHEVYRLPYHRSLRDYLHQIPMLKFFSKPLTLAELLLSHFFIGALPYSNIYRFACNYLKRNTDVKALMVSCSPFQLLHIGYKLHQKTGTPWIADYRDEWNTRSTKKTHSLPDKLLHRLDRNSERKWLTNASFFITVSNTWRKNISVFTGKTGHVVMNGYDPEDYSKPLKVDTSGKFTITYSGTLYPYQNIDVFFEAMECILQKYGTALSFTVNFLGIATLADVMQKVAVKTQQHSNVFNLTGKLPKQQAIETLQQSDVLLATSYENLKGVYPVKMFEYFACGIPVLLCPGDGDEMEKFVRETNCGYIANTAEECYHVLEKLVIDKLNGQKHTLNINSSKAEEYTRLHQAGVLAQLLNTQL